MPVPPRERLIVALDLPGVEPARAMVARLGDKVSFYKIGKELVYAGGLDLARDLVAAGKKVFLDLKLHDIPATVERATAAVSDLGATYLTVHAYPQTLAAAVRGKGDSNLRILGVSVLTSMNDDDLAKAGYGLGVSDLVRRRARQAYEAGAAGLICSPLDIAIVRDSVGDGLEIITPGVRPAGSDHGDQKRVLTPGEAIRAGADRLVVGRPITGAADPAAAAAAIVAEIAGAAA
ncbi:MAG TPA: orotidine-5'-phosphate decarboxylase [Beijerinckiaceae bacterium]|nr:orotidine-5'-phosphate decarboxylase [Beijerinckiaceae bacterium]